MSRDIGLCTYVIESNALKIVSLYYGKTELLHAKSSGNTTKGRTSACSGSPQVQLLEE